VSPGLAPRAGTRAAASAGADNRYSASVDTLTEVFRAGGTLASHFPEYTYRESQHRMAEIVWDSFAAHGHVALEAGTGIGKTFAYLIPVLMAGRRTIISTGTKTLQDQLFGKDLPALGGALGRSASVAVLKGRGNYLCWHRLELARADLARAREDRHILEALAAWGRSSLTGDLSEIEDLQDDFGLRAEVTSTADNCLGARCPSYDRCFVAEARRRAQESQIVVVNHHLLLADLSLKESGFGELLGDADSVVVDEAHLLPDIAQQFFGMSATTREIDRLGRDVAVELAPLKTVDDIHARLNGLGRWLGEFRILSRPLDGRSPWHSLPGRLKEALDECSAELAALGQTLASLEAPPPGLVRCAERCVDIASRIDHILGSDGEDGIRWVEAGKYSIGIHWTPIEVGDALAVRIGEQGGNWIFTSATLAVADAFDHFLSRVGLADAVTAVLPSPFDYRSNARIYIPEGLPDPRNPDYTDALMDRVWPLVDAAGGGAFMLFTSYRALHAAAEWLRHRPTPGRVLIQGEGSRSQLLEQFRETPSAVLLGTGSFWQGVDVRGPALRVVVIDKLPFAAPNDPLVAARAQAIRRDGGDPFVEFQLPQAVLALKQGIGRLIRDYGDRGLIVLGDPRLRTRSYGNVFLSSLPDAPLVDAFDEALEYAESLQPIFEPLHESAGG